MLKLLGRKTSSNVMEVLWCCEEIGLEFDREDVGGAFGRNDQPDYLAMNPNGLVPTIIDDGFVMWESNAVIRYLASKYAAGSTIWPDDLQTRAEADKWMDWQLSVVGAMITPIFWGLVRTAPEKRDMKAIEAAIQRGYKVWGILDKHLERRSFVAGDNLTLGDIPVGVHAFRWFNLVDERPSMPNLEAWYARLCERPAYKKNCMNPLE